MVRNGKRCVIKEDSQEGEEDGIEIGHGGEKCLFSGWTFSGCIFPWNKDLLAQLLPCDYYDIVCRENEVE
jgi:hypothetical protein